MDGDFVSKKSYSRESFAAFCDGVDRLLGRRDRDRPPSQVMHRNWAPPAISDVDHLREVFASKFTAGFTLQAAPLRP